MTKRKMLTIMFAIMFLILFAFVFVLGFELGKESEDTSQTAETAIFVRESPPVEFTEKRTISA